MRTKLCECGCGEAAPIATTTNRKFGHVKGQPTRFVHGHHLRKRLPKMSKLDIAWLAGLLEGEGSFVIHFKERQPKFGASWKQLAVRVQIAMTDEDIIHRVGAMFNAASYHKKPNKPGYKLLHMTSIAGPKAVALMKLIRPHMGVRRQAQITKAIQAFEQWTVSKPTWPRVKVPH